MTFLRSHASFAVAVFAMALVPLAQAQALPERFHQVHPAMGTEFTIDLYAADEQTAGHLLAETFDEIDRLDGLLSNYRATSELSRINREAAAGPVVTDPETFLFLERSVFWSRASGGTFDITVGPLLRAWGFFFHQGRVPAPETLSALRSQIGWQYLQLDGATRSVAFAGHRRLELDPGSIGKGFAVDRVVALLREQGVTAALISAGGSTVYAIGAPPGTSGWPVHVPDPRRPGATASTMLLKDTSLSTGACTEKFFIQNGHRYCHIFDPRTMRPMENMLQAAVVDPSATDSDALSTVVFLLPDAASAALLASRPATRSLVFRTAPAEGSCFAIHWPGSPCGPVATAPSKD